MSLEELIEQTIDHSLRLIADGELSAGRIRIQAALEANDLSKSEAAALAGQAMHVWVHWMMEESL